MTSPASLLRLIWLASPALPVGGFSYSEGLEAAVEAGLVGNERQASDWLLDQLQLTLARSDLHVVAAAFDAWLRHDLQRLEALDGWVAATRESRELRQQTEQMGRSLLAWLNNDGPRDDPRLDQLARLVPTWPIAFALAAARSGATAEQAALSFAFGWAENAVQSAIKCVPIGQAAGQRILARLAGAIPATVDAALRLSDAGRQAFAPMLAILSARHEIQYSRLFRS